MQRTPSNTTTPKPDSEKKPTPVHNPDFINSRARRKLNQQRQDTDNNTDRKNNSNKDVATPSSLIGSALQRTPIVPPQRLYRTPEQIFNPLSDLARSIRRFAANFNINSRSDKPRVIIEDLNTNEIFISPRASLSPFSEQLNLNITERKRGRNRPSFDRTLKIENPELLIKIKEDRLSENLKLNPTFTFPLKNSEQKRRLSSLQALTFPQKPSTSETKTNTPITGKRSLNFYYENELSPQSFKSRSESNSEESYPKMEFELGDILKTIPPFEGKEKELDTFINICESFYDNASENMRDRLPAIFKMKIIGRALARIQPTSELDTWARIKDKLESTFKKPITYELAQYELAMIKQRRNESIDSYAERILNGLERLNNAAKYIIKDEAALPHLITVNKRQALQHFEQNIYSDELRIRVDSANKGSLTESILFAKQKEISLKLNTAKTCDFCKMTGHEVEDCRRKNSNQPQPNTSGQSYRNYNNQNTNRFNPTNLGNNGRGYFNNNNNNYNNGNRFNNNGNSRFNTNNNSGNNSRYGNNGNNNYNNTGNRYGNNNYTNNGNRNGNTNNSNPYGNNRNKNLGNNSYGNNNINNNGRNETYYRDSRTTNNDNGNNSSNNSNRIIPQEQRGYFRSNNNNSANNPESNNQRYNFDAGNSRNNGGNARPNPTINNRTNVRTIQITEDQPELEYGQLTTTAQIHEKN